MSTTINPKDLTVEAPRSPRARLGGYIILARALDKGRAALAGKIGEYHFDCPVDNFLFSFKQVKGSDIKALLEQGATDDEVVAWLNTNGAPKTAAEIEQFNRDTEGLRPYDNPEQRDWFAGEASKAGLDPAKVTLFDWLDVDDKQSFSN